MDETNGILITDPSLVESVTLHVPKIVSAFVTLVYDDGSMAQHAATARDENGMTVEFGNAKSRGGGLL